MQLLLYPSTCNVSLEINIKAHYVRLDVLLCNNNVIIRFMSDVSPFLVRYLYDVVRFISDLSDICPICVRSLYGFSPVKLTTGTKNVVTLAILSDVFPMSLRHIRCLSDLTTCCLRCRTYTGVQRI